MLLKMDRGTEVSAMYHAINIVFLFPYSHLNNNNNNNCSILRTEILLDAAGLHQGVHQLRRAELVPLAHRGPGSLRPVPDLRRVRLPEERLLHGHHQQGDVDPKHLQALLLEVGLQLNVLQRRGWLLPAGEVSGLHTINKLSTQHKRKAHTQLNRTDTRFDL